MKTMSMRNMWMIAACMAAFLPVCGLHAQDGGRRGAFAGTWRLDLKKSYMGADHPDANYEFTKTFELNGANLEQKDREVNVDIIGFALPERNSTEEIAPDGREHTVQRPGFLPGMPPTPTQVTAEWQGDNLVLTESAESFIGRVSSSRRYFLSDDGGKLIELITGRTTYGDSEQRLVFTRVSESH